MCDCSFECQPPTDCKSIRPIRLIIVSLLESKRRNRTLNCEISHLIFMVRHCFLPLKSENQFKIQPGGNYLVWKTPPLLWSHSILWKWPIEQRSLSNFGCSSLHANGSNRHIRFWCPCWTIASYHVACKMVWLSASQCDAICGSDSQRF